MRKRKLSSYSATADLMHSRQVYALCDPRDDTIRYVGISIDARVRLYQHLHGYGGRQEWRWISELQKLGLSPVLLILEEIPTGPEAFYLAYEREEFWIREMLLAGEPLLNTYGVTRRYSRE